MICLKPSSWLASQKVDKNVQLHGRSPYGERGLKSVDVVEEDEMGESLSLRRAWIEIRRPLVGSRCRSCRSPYGERGLKLDDVVAVIGGDRRSPYGERGLK